MASNQVNINLSLQDQASTIKQRTDEVKGLNKELQRAQALATGTKTGSKAVAASYSAAGQNMEYGRARGSMGSTGAAGRDFANQAQGLGGLVRLYATYAANIFAVSAAFRALSDAMDTTNMVKGLDQLGAASGIAMGSLAKRFTEASGGAISFREAMESTAKAMSSGMSQKQFLQLGDVAKKASQALGINMSDAVSRLTRGITKLEPELLDELGIFTKVGKATEDYARSVGKSADSLTDFEKRQAFANAVLKEGLDKFSEINIATNPFDKLLASLKNIAQSILEILNKALAPLVDILSASPAALLAGITALGSMIVKQAIPAISNYRDELRKTADMSKQFAEQKLGAAEQQLAKRRADILARQDAAAQAKTDAIDKLETKLRELSGGRIRKDIAGILTPTRGIQDITEKEIQKIEKAGNALKTNVNVYTQLAQAIRAAQLEQQKYDATAAKLKAEEAAGPGRYSATGVLKASAEEQRKRGVASGIVSQAADTASLVGFKAAFGEMVNSLKTEKLGTLRTIFTGVTATATAAGTRILGLVGTLGNLGMIAGVIIGIFQALSAAFSKNSKEVDIFNQTVDISNDNIRALNNTFDKYKNALTSNSVIALTTSFTALSDNLETTISTFKNATKEANTFDNVLNAIKNIFGQGLETQFSKSIAAQVSAGLKGIVDPKVKAEAESKLKGLLDINDLTSKNIESALSGMSKSRLITIGQEIATTFDTASKAGQKTSITLMAIKDGFKSLETSYTDLANTLIQKDPLSTFGKDLATQGFKLADAFKDPIANLANLRDLLTDISKIKLLAPESQAIIMQNRDAYIALINTAKVYEDQLTVSEEKIKKLESSKVSPVNLTNARVTNQAALEVERAKAKETGGKLSETRDEMAALAERFSKAAEASISKGFALIEGSFARAMAQTILSSQKTVLDKLPQTAETAKLSAQLENQKIDLQIQQITETQRLVKEMELSRLQSEKQFLETRRDKALETATGEGRAAATRAPEARLKEIADREKLLTSTNISADIKAGKLAKTPEALQAMERQKGVIAQVTQLGEQKKLNELDAELKGIQSSFEKAKKTLDSQLIDVQERKKAELATVEFSQKNLEQQQQIIGAYIDEEDVLKRVLSTLESGKEIQIATTIQTEAQTRGWTNIEKLANSALATANAQFKTVDGQFVTAKKLADQERDKKDILAIQLYQLNAITQELEHQANLARIRADIDSSLTSIDREVLQTQLDLGIITSDSYRTQAIELDKLDRAKQKDIKLTQLSNSYAVTQINLAKEYAQAVADGKDLQPIKDKMAATSEAFNLEIDGINRVYEKQQRSKALTEDLTGRQLAYGDVFKKSFEGMADAVIEFTKTGKLNFKGMIDSMIEGLIRYEMQQQAMMAYQAFRPGLMGFLGDIFGTSSGALTNKLINSGGTSLPGFSLEASGGVYDAGLRKFAKGGMFTNSIVNSPTLFKFAKGTGLMGEAGPEAIMPLHRGADGSLGVKAGNSGGNVDVVVNNYGSEKATTKETTDSRGNRKIEVVIGDMVAGEIGRSGSSIQQSLAGNFNSRPAVARR